MSARDDVTIRVAETAGFCNGVRSAVSQIFGAAKNGDVEVLGKLVHNDEFVRFLEKRGIGVAQTVEEVTAATMAIRTHGAVKGTEEMATARGLKVIDATCPNVRHLRDVAVRMEEQGRHVVVVGKPDHAEIVGLRSLLSQATVVHCMQDLTKIPRDRSLALVGQTTQDRGFFEQVREQLLGDHPDVLVRADTICPTTRRMQEEAVALAHEVDTMVVVGGRDSSNTRRLSEMCGRITRTHWVLSASELQRDWFDGVRTIGVTAGASTPDFSIEEVVTQIGAFVG